MRFRTSLRYRVTLSFAVLGMVASLGLAGALYILTIAMEQRLITETLAAELEDYIARYEIDPNTTPPATTTLRSYVIVPGAQDAPAVLLDLPAGLHRVRLEGKDYYAEVQLRDKQRFIALYDDRQIRQRENEFKLYLGIGVVTMTLLSALLGLWLAARVVAPVGALAARVAARRAEDHPSLLAGKFPRDEVGMLAREFDAYLQRLAAFIEREQAFTADVSHELRTPLAIIEGATDVLLDDPGLSEEQRSRVKRIERSACEMSELISALLLLAREEQGDVSESGCTVSEVLQQVIAGHQHLLQQKSVEIKLNILTETILPVECTLLRVVLANLVRNAILYTEQGYVSIYLDNKGVSVEDTGVGIPRQQLQRIFDRYYTGPTGSEGIGLSLVKRICQHYGWRIQVDSNEGEGTHILLSFTRP